MPSEISISDSQEQYLTTAWVWPGNAGRIALRDSRGDPFGIVVVNCEPGDRTSNIYAFGKPDDVDIDDAIGLLEYCTSQTYERDVDPSQSMRMETYDQDGKPIEVHIGHMVLMAAN